MSSPLKNLYIRVNWHNKYSSRFAVVSSPLPYRSADDNVPPLALYNVGICWVVVVVSLFLPPRHITTTNYWAAEGRVRAEPLFIFFKS